MTFIKHVVMLITTSDI